MCGLVGEVRFYGDRVDPMALTRARDVMYARGPDAEGLWVSEDQSIGLAHRRLSILDLDARSNQPFSDPSGRYVLVFNGEIYNFQELRKELAQRGLVFVTTSDTEVLLHSLIVWGKDACCRLNGMFAFAFWDNDERRLLLARDRFGVKPLYVDFGIPDRVAFASTLGPLLELGSKPRELNCSALAEYFRTLYIPTPESAIRGIIKLAAGTLIEVGANGDVRHTQWWSPSEEADVALPRSSEELVSLIDLSLREAVKRRLVSDVPVGLLLSGGIDSSLIAAHMADVADAPVDTFTIAFDQREYDESHVAAAIARHLHTRHHVLTARPDDLVALTSELPVAFDEPFADASVFPTLLLSRLTRRTVTVALCGDGGDELFGGYNYYRWLSTYQTVFRVPLPARRLLALMRFFVGPTASMMLGGLGQEDLPALFSYMRSTSKSADWNRLLRTRGADPGHRLALTMSKDHRADIRLKAMGADLAHFLPDDILVKGDRASMAASLEARHPFLDINVVRYALSLPAKAMFRHGQGKWILRRMLSKYVPAEISSRPKQGFRVPVREWFRGPLRGLLHDMLSEAELADDPLVDPVEVNRLVNEHISLRRNHENLLWAILVYRLWLKRFGAKLTVTESRGGTSASIPMAMQTSA